MVVVVFRKTLHSMCVYNVCVVERGGERRAAATVQSVGFPPPPPPLPGFAVFVSLTRRYVGYMCVF